MNLQIADCLPAWLRGCLMTSNDCTRDRIAIKYRIFGFIVWRSKQRIEQTIECIHQILLLCLPPPLKRSTDLNDRNVHEISICSNVIFEHNLSIDEGGNPSKWKREIERVFAIDLTSQEVSLCVFVFVFGFESSRNWTTMAKAKKKEVIRQPKTFISLFFYFFLREFVHQKVIVSFLFQLRMLLKTFRTSVCAIWNSWKLLLATLKKVLSQQKWVPNYVLLDFQNNFWGF